MAKRLAIATELVRSAQRIVCLTGAGVSAESGVATFRDAQSGLWARFDPAQLASQAGFAADPGLVWQWYMQRLQGVAHAAPNPGHVALAHLQARSADFVLVTQNVDDLHERAGSLKVIHLHGQISQFHCNDCGLRYSLAEADRSAVFPPTCGKCGGLIRPSVIWFGEALPESALDAAWHAAGRCDLFLCIGTSGVVYPAAQLPQIARRQGARLIEINPDETPLSPTAEIHLPGPSGVILPQLVAQLG
ncbi:MAG: NAD-dependent deacylase [Anaerolineales bacterium]|nr:NAD-dependent deacylase [Anaerolineales bacterium]